MSSRLAYRTFHADGRHEGLTRASAGLAAVRSALQTGRAALWSEGRSEDLVDAWTIGFLDAVEPITDSVEMAELRRVAASRLPRRRTIETKRRRPVW